MSSSDNDLPDIENRPLRSRINAPQLTEVEIDQTLRYNENADRSFYIHDDLRKLALDIMDTSIVAEHTDVKIGRARMLISSTTSTDGSSSSSEVESAIGRVGTPQATCTIPRPRWESRTNNDKPSEDVFFSPKSRGKENIHTSGTKQKNDLEDYRSLLSKVNLSIYEDDEPPRISAFDQRKPKPKSTVAKHSVDVTNVPDPLSLSPRSYRLRIEILEERRKEVLKELISARNAYYKSSTNKSTRMVAFKIPTMSMEDSIKFFEEKKRRDQEKKRLESQSKVEVKLENPENSDGTMKQSSQSVRYNSPIQDNAVGSRFRGGRARSAWYVSPNHCNVTEAEPRRGRSQDDGVRSQSAWFMSPYQGSGPPRERPQDELASSETYPYRGNVTVHGPRRGRPSLRHRGTSNNRLGRNNKPRR